MRKRLPQAISEFRMVAAGSGSRSEGWRRFLQRFPVAAKNSGIGSRTWLYNGQVSSKWVSHAKMASWYLLLHVSFVTVTLVFREVLSPAASPARHTEVVSQ